MKKINLESLIFGPEKGCPYVEIFLHFFLLRVLGTLLLFLSIAIYSDYHKDGEGDFIPIAASVLAMAFIFNLINYLWITYDYFQIRSKVKEKDDAL